MSEQLLIEYLDRRKADYTLHSHLKAYTAPEIAEQCHVAGNTFAKVVMVKVDGVLAMVVLPAHFQVDLDELTMSLGVSCITLACEREFAHRFPRCEIGAMPPFGHLYGLDTYMIPVFENQRKITFNAGTHSEIIRMSMYEYLRFAYVTEVDKCAIPFSLKHDQYDELLFKNV
ncbi:MAG: Ala-tRNA(Pro) deacylase [Gammaproteobacteria bacterium]|jgi:Ala-tRNA(Pro) deacylase